MSVRNALSCSYIDVNNAVNGGGPFLGPANAGDVVNIPANVFTGGTFVLHGVTFAWDVSSATMKTGLVGAGLPAGITVKGDHFNGWVIIWPTLGPQTLLTGDASGITNGVSPSGLTLTVSRALEGDVGRGRAEKQYVSITTVWPSALTITKGIILQGQTDQMYRAGTLVAGASIGVNVSTLSNSQLHVVSTDGFDPNGGILDINTSAISDTACGQLTYTSIVNSTTFGGVSNGASPDWASTAIGTLDAFSFVGQSVCRDRTIIGCGLNKIIVMSNATGTCEVTGLSFRQASSPPGGNGYIVATKPNFKFHHNHMGTRIGSLHYVYFDVSTPPATGVVYRNVIDNPNVNPTGGQNQISYSTFTPASVGGGDATWSKPSDYLEIAGYGRGGPNMSFFEDNYFWSNSYTGGSGGRTVWDGAGGMRPVVRHNFVWNFTCFNHGTEGSERCGRSIENYNNIGVAELNASLESYSNRGGAYLIGNNRYYGPLADLTGHPGAFRATGAVYASPGLRSSAFGWNPWDFNDTSNGHFAGCKRPDGSTAHPSATKGVGSAIYTYDPVNGRYVVSNVTATGGAPSTSPVLTDTGHSGTWQSGQWTGFQVTRVSNAGTGSLGIALSGSVNLATLTGTQTVTLTGGSGVNLRHMTGIGPGPSGTSAMTLGCITIPGSPDKYILFQKIVNDTIHGCWSPDTGTVSGSVESGDMWQGPIISNTPTTVTAAQDPSNGIKKATTFVTGDKYIIARCISCIDAGARGSCDLLSFNTSGGDSFWVNTTQGGIAAYPRNKMEPFYNFNNVQARTGNKMVCSDGNNSQFIANQDFFNDNTSWTPGNPVLSGVAVGTKANMPTTNAYSGQDVTGIMSPAPWVGYYATDDTSGQDPDNPGVLYVLTAAATGPGTGWTKWWAPYPYPHPLAAGGATQSITSAASASFVNGTGGTFQAVSFGFSAPPVWSNTGTLPTGTTFDGSGLLTIGGSTAVGNYAFTIIATNGSETASQSFTLTVAVAATKIIGLTGPVAFGNVDINTTSTKTLTISNTGTVVLTVTSITLPSGYTANWTSGTVTVGGSQQVIVTFAPLTATDYSGTLTVVSDKTSGTNTIAISGTGTTRVIGLSGDLAFGNITIGQTATRQLTVNNTGNVALTISAIAYPPGFSGDFTSGTIAAGASKIINVTFSPIAAQVYSGNVDIQSDKTSGTSILAISGTGVAAPTKIVQLSGDLNFGNVQTGTTVNRTLTITNGGDTTLNVSGITYPAGFTGVFAGTVAPGASHDVTVTFAPVAASNYSGTVTVASDATGGTNTTSASGTGVTPATAVIGLSGNLAFGNVQATASSTRTLTIANTGSAPLTISGITYPTGFTGAYAGTIAPGATQNVTVTFAPTLVQNYSGTVTVASNATGGTGTASASGAGVAAQTKIIAITGNLVFGNVQKGHTVQKIMAIANTGTAALSVTGITCPTGFTVNLTSASIAPGASQNVTVTFKPVAQQSYGGDIAVTSDKTSGVNTIACSGNGTNKRQVPFILIVG